MLQQQLLLFHKQINNNYSNQKKPCNFAGFFFAYFCKMQALKRIAKNAIQLNRHTIIKQALSNSSIQQDILELNTQEQLFEKGVDSAGDSLGEYAPSTIIGVPGVFKGKIEKGQPIDRITLKDTGHFYESFRFKNEKEGFLIHADALLPDGGDLVRNFGKYIIGLTNENQNKLSGWLIAPIQELTLAAIRA